MNHGEPCVLCQHETEVDKETPSYMREHFIDGAGQLCEDCYVEIAKNKEWHNLL